MTLTTKKINTLLSVLAVITSINLSAQPGGAEPVKVGVPNAGVVYSKNKSAQDGYTLICTTNSRWYMGLYKEGTYYLECNNRFTKLVIIK